MLHVPRLCHVVSYSGHQVSKVRLQRGGYTSSWTSVSSSSFFSLIRGVFRQYVQHGLVHVSNHHSSTTHLGLGQRTLDPIFNVFDILTRILEIIQHMLRVRVQEARFGCSALVGRQSPRAMLDSSGNVPGQGILKAVSDVLRLKNRLTNDLRRWWSRGPCPLLWQGYRRRRTGASIEPHRRRHPFVGQSLET